MATMDKSISLKEYFRIQKETVQVLTRKVNLNYKNKFYHLAQETWGVSDTCAERFSEDLCDPNNDNWIEEYGDRDDSQSQLEIQQVQNEFRQIVYLKNLMLSFPVTTDDPSRT